MFCDLLMYMLGVSYGDGLVVDLWVEVEMQGWYFVYCDELIQDMIYCMVVLFFDVYLGEKYIYGYLIDIFGVVVEVVLGQLFDGFLWE